jgi:hypothetical protein
MTAADAVKELEKLNFDVAKEPIAIAKTGKVIEGRFAIARKDTEAVLGIVSKDYRIIKHGDAMAAPAKVLMNEGYEISSSYQSDFGSKAILELRSKDITKINDDNYKTRLYLLNSYDGSTSLRIEFGLFRLVCLNGAGSNAKDKDVTSIAHIGTDKLFDKDIVLKFLSVRASYIKSFEEIVKRLGDYKVANEEDAAKILENLEFGKRTVKNVIDEWKKDINYSPTLYGLYNGISSLWTRKIEKPDKKEKGVGNRVMHAQWITNRVIHQMNELATSAK